MTKKKKIVIQITKSVYDILRKEEGMTHEQIIDIVRGNYDRKDIKFEIIKDLKKKDA